ncbi:hypothetical protein GGF31_008606 [Allomyces arbusculus]|nr:hypothetical protein GGF31_008606 [Allomyces arbusculus]
MSDPTDPPAGTEPGAATPSTPADSAIPPAASAAPVPPWLARIQTQLDGYDRASAVTRDIISDYSRLFSQALYLNKVVHDLRDATSPASAVADDQPAPAASAVSPRTRPLSRSASTSHVADAAALERRLELMRRDKERAEHDLNEQVQQNRDLQALLARQERANRQLAAKVLALTQQVDDLAGKLKDAHNTNYAKDQAIVVLQDELAATQLELNVKSEQHDKAKAEYAQLLDRYLKEKSALAAKVNDANEFIEATRSLSTRVKSTFTSLFTGGGGGGGAATASAPVTSEPWPPKNEDAEVVPQQVERTVTAHDEESVCVAVSGPLDLVATGGVDKQVKLWHAVTAQPVATLSGALSSILAMSFSTAGNSYLVTGSNDYGVRLYAPVAGSGTFTPPRTAPGAPVPPVAMKLVHTFTGHNGKVTAVAVTGRGDLVVSGGADRTLRVWDVAKGNGVKSLAAASACLDLAIADYSGTTIVSAHQDGRARVWDVNAAQMSSEVVVAGTGPAAAPVISIVQKDPNTFVVLARDHKVRLVDMREGKVVHTLSSAFLRVGSATKLGQSPGGTYVGVGATDGSIHVWDWRTDDSLVLTGGHGSQVNDVKWHPRLGTRMYSIDKGGHLTFWTV